MKSIFNYILRFFLSIAWVFIMIYVVIVFIITRFIRSLKFRKKTPKLLKEYQNLVKHFDKEKALLFIEKFNSLEQDVITQEYIAKLYFYIALSSEDDEKIRYMDKVIEIDKSGQNYYIRARTKQGLGEYTEAIIDFNKAIENGDPSARAHCSLVECHEALGNHQQVIENGKIFAKTLNDSWLKTKMANAYLGLNRYQEALELYLTINSEDPMIIHNIGLSYFKLKDYENSLIYYLKAIELSPEIPGFYNNLAELYITISNYEDAVKIIEKLENDFKDFKLQIELSDRERKVLRII